MILKHIKRKLSGFMCAVMLMTSSLNNIAYAVVDGSVNIGTNDHGAPPPMGAVDSKLVPVMTGSTWDFNGNCGLRITVIDKQGKQVSNSVDVVVYNIFRLLDQLKYDGDADATTLEYFNANRGGSGSGSGSRSGSGSGSIGSHIGSLGGIGSLTNFINSIQKYGINILMNDGKTIDKVYNTARILYGIKFDSTPVDSYFTEFKGGKYTISSFTPVTDNQYIGFIDTGSSKYNIKVTTFQRFGDYFTSASDAGNSSIIHDRLSGSIPTTSLSGDAFKNLLTLEDKSGQSGFGARTLLNWKTDSGAYMLAFVNDEDSKAISDNKTPFDIAREKGYKILVEPIVWTMPYMTAFGGIFENKNPRAEELSHTTGNNLFQYCSQHLVYGSVTQVAMFIAGEAINSYGKISWDNVNTWDNLIGIGGDDLIQVMASTYTLAKNDTDIKFDDGTTGVIAPLREQGYPIFSYNSGDGGHVINLNNLVTGNGLKNYKMVGYACGILDIKDLVIPSTRTPSKTGVPEIDQKEQSKVVKIYLDKEGDEMRQTGYFETEQWHTGDVSVSNETHDDGKEYKVYKWVVSKTDKDLSGYENGKDLMTEVDKLTSKDKGDAANESVKLEDKDTLYVILTGDGETIEGAKNQIVLHENELAHTYRMSDINPIPHLYAHFGARRNGNCDLDEEDYNFSVKNSLDYNNTDFIGGNSATNFRQTEVGDADDENGPTDVYAFDTEGMDPNTQFSLYRNKSLDKATMYPEKPNDKGLLRQIGITNESYKYTGGRKKDTGSFDWESQFKVNYKHTNLDRKVVGYYEHDSEYCNGHHITARGTMKISLSTFNALYSKANNVKTKGFTGYENVGDKVGSGAANFTTLGMTFNRNMGVQTGNNGKFIEFYPYFKMRYQTSDDYDVNNSGSLYAYLTASNLSKLSANSFVEAGIFREGVSGENSNYGIAIESEQWSTHKRAIKGLTDANVDDDVANHSLIPGGAIVNLSTSNSNDDVPDVWLGVRAYEVTIPDNLKRTLNNSDVVTTTEAKAKGVDFYNQIQTIMKGYQLEKWVKKGIVTTDSLMNGATKVSGRGAAKKFEGNTLQNGTNSKYYLKTGKTGGNGAQFSLANQAMEQHVYNIKAEIVGRDSDDMKVVVSKDGAEIASVDVQKKADVLSLLSNEELRTLDDKTCLITNFSNALDIGLGKGRNGRPWYYEAQDGIEVVETSAKMQIVFGDANGRAEVRSEVVDPKLCGKLDDHSDIINFDEDKTRTVQYRMSDKSEAALSKGSGYIGTFNGMDICLSGMNSVMRTRLTYMSNNTVMDLN